MSYLVDDLDASLQATGEDIILRRGVEGSTQDVTVRAHVRNYRLNADDLVNGIASIPLIINISMTQIRAAGWPAGALTPAAPFNVDPAIPLEGDTVIVKGQVKTVKAVEPLMVDNELVRVKLMAVG